MIHWETLYEGKRIKIINSTKKIELLAPAGDYKSFRAAVENGADAVYLGGKLFNARQLAGNFDIEQLMEALDYAHIRGVFVYLTMNTLILDNEIQEAVEFANEAWLRGIDGIIVQDIGFAAALKQTIPDLPLHASTQMTIHNIEGAKKLESLGFKRVVLARELPLEEIKSIVEQTSLEVEIFIHGALCISYSGQCLMSSIIGGRSGNRGRCAQPCRLPYKLVKENVEQDADFEKAGRYLLSPKDLCTLEELENIVSTGVKSLKIEGRMKTPEYVATVVGIYRKHLDHIIPGLPAGTRKLLSYSKDMQDLTQIFNRGGFTRGYLQGKPGREMISMEKPKNWGIYLGEVLSFDSLMETVKIKLEESISIGDGIEVWNGEDESPGTVVTKIISDRESVTEVNEKKPVEIGYIRGNIHKGNKVYKTSDKKLICFARESFEGRSRRKLALRGTAVLKNDMPLMLKVKDDDGNETSAIGTIKPEKAINRPLTAERLAEQLEKTGATAFEFSALSIELDEMLSIPISEINEVRRKALEELESIRISKPLMNRARGLNISYKNISKDLKHKNKAPGISILFYECNFDKEYLKNYADRYYIPFKSLFISETGEFIQECKSKGSEVYIWLPVIMRCNYMKLFKERLPELKNIGIEGILTGNIGAAQILRELDIPGLRLIGDSSLNIFNKMSVFEYEKIGFNELTLSTELNLNQILGIAEMAAGDFECIVYGRLPLMNTEYCPVGCIKDNYTQKSPCKGSCKIGRFFLKDRLGIDFPIICDNIDCRSTLMNSNTLFAPDAVKKLKASNINMLRLCILDESPALVGDLINLHKTIIMNESINIYENLIDSIKAGGFTKGHFFRGVQDK